jgi:L-arabinokinase
VIAVFYITGHGFGHASRTLAVVNALLAVRPETRVIVRSRVPAWFLRGSAPATIEIQAADTDTGVIQRDSLSLDEPETIRQAGAFYRDFLTPAPGRDRSRVDDEAAFLTAIGATIVVGDIPPLAFAAAGRAGIPSVALGNFTWDWIYGGYPAFAREAADVIGVIRDAYACATLALRLPFHGGFASLPLVRDIPLVARRANRSRDEARRLLDVEGRRPVVLASFGGHGLRLSYADIAERNDLTLVVTDHEAAGVRGRGRLHVLATDDLNARGIRYADLVSAADVVISKPGYGIISECIANGAALLYTLRGRFIEQDVFLREMPRVLRTREISKDDLHAGRWEGAVKQLLTQPPPPERLSTDGAEVARDEILRIADSTAKVYRDRP